MKFLADQDVYAVTLGFLNALGHDVVPAAQVGLARAQDAELLRFAGAHARILVTRDRDLGGLIFIQGGGSGVIYLRMDPSSLHAVHAELGRVLSLYSEQELQNSFVVIEPGRHRTRKLASGQGP